jgi:hypothetical protein
VCGLYVRQILRPAQRDKERERKRRISHIGPIETGVNLFHQMKLNGKNGLLPDLTAELPVPPDVATPMELRYVRRDVF